MSARNTTRGGQRVWRSSLFRATPILASGMALALALVVALVAAPTRAIAEGVEPDSALSTMAGDPEHTVVATVTAADISKYGNLGLSCTNDELFATFEYGDVVEVRFLDKVLDLPFCSAFSDVDSGSAGLFANVQVTPPGLAINMGDFATTYGIATKTQGDGKTVWNYAEGVEGPVSFTFTLKEAGGYANQLLMRSLSYTNDRNDYPQLSDDEFANFRPVTTTGMGTGRLYRSASPISDKHARNAYAAAAARRVGVTEILNLADTEEEVTAYSGYEDSYYATVGHVELGMDVNFLGSSFRKKLATALRYIAGHRGTYLVHCSEGKDRSGMVAALLECLMGASADEVVADYMTSYYNYYGITPDDDRYERIAEANVVKTLRALLDVDDLEKADLVDATRRFVCGLGLSADELAAVETNLSGRAPTHTVSFALGGYGVAIEPQVVRDGHVAVKPADPDAAGFVFGGWFVDDKYTEAFDFNATVLSDLVLYAKWVALPTDDSDDNSSDDAESMEEEATPGATESPTDDSTLEPVDDPSAGKTPNPKPANDSTAPTPSASPAPSPTSVSSGSAATSSGGSAGSPAKVTSSVAKRPPLVRREAASGLPNTADPARAGALVPIAMAALSLALGTALRRTSL